jgi:hypothetical protein
MLRHLGPWTILALALTVGLLPGSRTPAGVLHLALAGAVLPLIIAAMCHFVPVLTRTRPATRAGIVLPSLALLGGLVGGYGLAHDSAWLPAGLLLGSIAAAATLAWSALRAGQGLGDPHPGLAWYQGALGCLLLSLLAMLAALSWPAWWPQLKRAHLHLNLLGFVGLTALGTLQVLLPTAGGYADPGAGRRLRRGFRWAFAGTLATAAGAAAWPPLAWAGGLAWLFACAAFARDTLRERRHWLAWHGSGIALAGALGGFLLLLLIGLAHATGLLLPRPALLLVVPLFLLPLVSGALTHLLPLWRWPGAGPAQAAMRARLAHGAALRVIACFTSAAGLAGGLPGAAWPALLAGVQFLWQVVRGTRDARRVVATGSRPGTAGPP